MIHTWLDQIEREAIVPKNIIALYFGLYETEKGYCIYLARARALCIFSKKNRQTVTFA